MVAVKMMFPTIMMATVIAVRSLDTNQVFDPCSDSKVRRWDGFTFGLAFSSKDSFFSKQIQLSPCDSRLSLCGNAKLAVFRPKVDELTVLTIKTTDFDPTKDGGYMVAFAGKQYAARSIPALVADKSNIITSFTLVLEFQEGRLINLYWKKFGCKSCAEKSSVCLNNQECATPISKCKTNVDCNLKVQLAFSGTDKALGVLNSWYEVKKLREYSLGGMKLFRILTYINARKRRGHGPFWPSKRSAADCTNSFSFFRPALPLPWRIKPNGYSNVATRNPTNSRFHDPKILDYEFDHALNRIIFASGSLQFTFITIYCLPAFDLIEEAKLRTVWWAICIFAVTYFLTHTSKSMWMNVPIAILLVSGAHILLTEVDFHWKTRKSGRRSYLSHLEKKQLSVNDSRLNTLPPPPKWKRKIDSPVVEAAMDDFTNKILQEFVLDLWYSDITPDKEAPELIHAIIMDILAEISMRVKDINLVDMLTRDVVDLVGDHLELFRKNQASIGREVMVTLSSEERDERLKHHLMASNELHPALISPESEYKFLKRIMGALLAAVLRPREAQCPLVRCVTRELLTCLIMEPVMRFASPGRINELIEGIFLATNKGEKEGSDDQSNVTDQIQPQNQSSSTTTNNEKGQELTSFNTGSSCSQNSEKTSTTPNTQKETTSTVASGPTQDESMHTRTSDWARVLEAATQRRTEVLQPENLENMWTKGRNYMKKSQKNSIIKSGMNENSSFDSGSDQNLDGGQNKTPTRVNFDESLNFDSGSDGKLKRLNSASESNILSLTESIASPIQVGGTIIPEFYSANAGRDSDVTNVNVGYDNKVIRTEGYVPKLRCRVLGAFFENIDSKSFAVYSIAVTDADNKTWNFERLHRHLKDIPNYTLHLPPKRIFSSSTEDAFVHQRCIQLDKYLKDLLSIANIAEQHEVWDFLSMSSKRYCFGRSSSVVKALAVNVDDAVDDIVRQFKGGLKRKIVGPGSPSESPSLSANRNVTWDTNEGTDSPLRQPTFDMTNFVSDYEECEKDKTVNNEEMESMGQVYGGNFDNDVNLRGISPKIVNKSEEQNNKNLVSEKKNNSEVRSEVLNLAAKLYYKWDEV
ncbi:hypothetical protein L2E82_25260 [Cichorium intybus]|uniref:Uncharacterized protein n=1 Tax=Cichorium intybus TaxID=13427 RepID=A0ACB9E2S9_CICIN|nr:hypothetical protein L2E82_25260 [Cichorium intybus]